MALRVAERYVLPTDFTAGRPIEPNVPFEPQLLSQWCWAACVSMVERGLGRAVSQCEVANRLFPELDCCQGFGSGCSETRPVHGIASTACNQVAGRRDISDLWSRTLGRTVHVEPPISEERLVEAVEAGPGHAVQLWWVNGSEKHVVLVVGHQGGQFLVHDPCAQERLMSFFDLESDGTYTWRLTWVL